MNLLEAEPVSVEFRRVMNGNSLIASTDFLKRFFCNDVTAREHHWWICICTLFLADRADEDRVEEIRWRKGDFNLWYNISISTTKWEVMRNVLVVR